MDLRPPFTVTGKILKIKKDAKSSEAPKAKVKEALINREKRVFGTVRNQNAVSKAVTDQKPARKNGIPQKKTKQSANLSAVQETDGTPQKPPEKNNLATSKKKSASDEKVEENIPEKILQDGDVSRAGLRSPFLVNPRKKSVNFSEKVEEIKEKASQEGDVSGTGARTPLRSPFLLKSNATGTPYHSAERCSKCRFDKLETSSYWLGQIRLAESVGKHFVSAAFFKLAFQCQAEPIRNIKVELKKYLGRHEHSCGGNEWKDLCVSYGLMKEESSIKQDNQEEGRNEDAAARIDDEEEKQIVEAVNEGS